MGPALPPTPPPPGGISLFLKGHDFNFLNG